MSRLLQRPSAEVCPYLKNNGKPKKHDDRTDCWEENNALDLLRKRCDGQKSCKVRTVRARTSNIDDIVLANVSFEFSSG